MGAAGPTPPRLVPAGETDDRPRQVPDYSPRGRGSQLRAQRRIRTGFPLNRPRRIFPWAAPWSTALLRLPPTGCQIVAARIMETAMTATNARLAAIFSAILIAAALRLVPHPPNFTPIGAIALFGGAYFGRRALAFAAPLGALLLSDAILGFHSGMPYVYGSVALIVLIGWLVAKRMTALTIAAAAVVSSVLFFTVTNFGTWATGELYPPTLAGLAACYVAAIPFFQNTLAGDLVFSALLFGGFALLERRVPMLRAPDPQPA
jgi:hypothetical protein